MIKFPSQPESPYDVQIDQVPIWWRGWLGDEYIVGVQPTECIDEYGHIQQAAFLRDVVVANLATGEVYPASRMTGLLDDWQSPDLPEIAFFLQEAEDIIQKNSPASVAAAA